MIRDTLIRLLRTALSRLDKKFIYIEKKPFRTQHDIWLHSERRARAIQAFHDAEKVKEAQKWLDEQYRWLQRLSEEEKYSYSNLQAIEKAVKTLN